MEQNKKLQIKEYLQTLKGKNKYCVYEYKNKKTGLIYVGSCIDILGRYIYHLERNDTDLDKDITKYGIENFSFKILATFNNKIDYQNYEKYIIIKYNKEGLKLYNKVLYNKYKDKYITNT